MAGEEYEAAFNAWSEALCIFEDTNEAVELAETQLHLAEILEVLGDVTRMREVLDRVRDRIEKADLGTFWVEWWDLFGKLCAGEGDFQQALEAFESARQKVVQSGGMSNDARRERLQLIALRCAEIHFAAKRYQDAVRILLEEGILATPPVGSSILAQQAYLLALIASTSNGVVPENSLVYLKRGIASLSDGGSAETRWRLYVLAGREYLKRGNLGKARESFVEALKVLEALLERFASPGLRSAYLVGSNRAGTLRALCTHLGTSSQYLGTPSSPTDRLPSERSAG